MRFLFRPIKRNFRSRKETPIKYLVIHDTGNTNPGAGALNHRNYVENNERGASAHYFVDDKVIVQYVGDSLAAGSVGDGKGKYGITNSNSLSIEMCINSDGNYLKMYKNTVELTKNLMKKFNIPWERVVRHYDASRKNCPGHMGKNNWEKWKKFKEDIKKPIEWKIDLSKDSEFGVNKVMEKDYKGHWAEKAIDEVKEAGIMKGYEDGSFKPDEKITRAEVAVIVSKLLKKN
ncbi:MAG: N-acetylmuramoyl-L-alanine amidase [Peptoniphilus grossensis]